MKIEVFKAGTQTDSAGNTKEWTTEDLDTMVELYAAERAAGGHEAPVVLGHPLDNSPAYGWVEKFERVGETLFAYLKDLQPEFVKWVENKLYKKRSISLYPDLLPRHVGFLGGVPPAVKGLSDIQMAQHKFQAKGDEAFVLEFAEDPVLSAATPATVNPRKARSEKFNITALAEKGFDEKPNHYSSLLDEDFADPVNYRFPITKSYITAALASWSRDTVQKDYTEQEQQVIAARIIKAAQTYGIELTPFTWAYSEAQLQNPNLGEEDKTALKNYLDVPPSLLSKSQLVKVIEGLPASGQTPTTQQNTTTGNVNNQSLNLEESSMDEAKMFQLHADLIAWIGETFGEEVANQTSAKLTELVDAVKAAAPPANSSTEGGAAPINANEAPEMVAMRRKLERLELINRTNENEKFCENLMAGEKPKLLPKQKGNILSLLEMAHHVPTPVSFSEGDKKVTKPAVELVKAVLGSLEPQADFSEQARQDRAFKKADGGGNAEFSGMKVDEDAMAEFNEVQDYIAEQKKAGVTLSFKEALSIVSKEGN